MTESGEREIILEHALAHKNNLEMAVDIAFAYTDLRRRIIVAFAEKLERFVLRRLDESQWKVNASLRADPFERWAGFSVTKNAWAGRYVVGLEAGAQGAKDLIIGVAKQAETLPSIEGLKQALDAQIRHGTASSWWDWYHPLEHPYRHWDNKDALITMYDETAVEPLGTYLLRIIEVAAPVIDSYVSAH